MQSTTTIDPVNMYNYLNQVLLNPTIFLSIIIIITVYYMYSFSLGSAGSESYTTTPTNSSSSNIFSIIIIVILLILILVNALQYFFSIDVTAIINGLFTPNAQVDIIVDQSTYKPSTVPEIKFRKQVFNIPGNNYKYEDAKAICKAYGADLATYQQIENAYDNGAEWCNYGWSAGQMALFPTQQNTFDQLQNIKGHEHDCGRPGINGGYIANPNVKFGVNCYGDKPKMNQEEENLMQTMPRYPQNKQDLLLEKKIDYWKNKVNEILVSPFNHDQWSEGI
jgi:hypothetical protein